MEDLLAALALVLVLEGMLPFLSPVAWRDAVRRLAELEPRTIRIAGIVSIACGLVMLKLVRG